MKKVRVNLSKEAKEVYQYLNQEATHPKIAQSILNSINNKVGLIKENFQYGEPISTKLIPKVYTKEYEITNHKNYNKLFGYK